MRVWVTRAQPGADATAQSLAALGHNPLVASLLEVHRLPSPLAAAPAGTAAIAFTSANAVRAFAAWSSERGWPVFTVGDATAQAARQAGFDRVTSADGDVAALARRLAADVGGLVLHPCAREAAGDLAGGLSSSVARLQTLALYETRAATLTPAAMDALGQAAPDAVLVHSPKGAQALAAAVEAPGAPDAAQLHAYALSRACLAPLASCGFAKLTAAAEPNVAALLALLG